MRSYGQGQKAGKVPGDRPEKEHWKVDHDLTTIWERVSAEELVKRRLYDRDNWGEQVSVMILIRRGRQVEWVGRGENQKWTIQVLELNPALQQEMQEKRYSCKQKKQFFRSHRKRMMLGYMWKVASTLLTHTEKRNRCTCWSMHFSLVVERACG